VISCHEHGEFLQRPNDHLTGYGCPRCCSLVSEAEVQYLDSLGVSTRQHTIVIGNRTYRVDGYDPETNTVYEFLGDYWHGNPDVYGAEDVNPSNGRTFGNLYRDTQERLETLRLSGYKVIATWESDWKAK
jgi:hypothetical protein